MINKDYLNVIYIIMRGKYKCHTFYTRNDEGESNETSLHRSGKS